MLFKYNVEIEVDEKTIEQKYPNYRFNFSSLKEFADNKAFCWECEGLEGNEVGLEKWGYSIRIEESSQYENKELVIAALGYVGSALTGNMQEETIVLNAVIKALKSENYNYSQIFVSNNSPQLFFKIFRQA